jgi:site-specific DNA recombinase
LPIFQVAVSRKESCIHILNEPLKGSSVLLVETGEGCSLARTRLCFA